MTNERLLELINYFETSKKTTEYLLSSQNFDENKKIPAAAALILFQDTINALELAMKYNQKNSNENLTINTGEQSGEQSE